jgi:uncharacterized damage-inducible protein DinB
MAMSDTSSAQRIEIMPYWATVQRDLLALVDLIPDERMDWSPKPELWNFRGILLHIAAVREGWLGGLVKLEGQSIDVWGTVRTKEQIKDAYARTWERVERFLGDSAKLDAVYDRDDGTPVTGHWIAFHLLEHDIHHRADIFHYLALLGIETPDVGTP